MLKLYKILEDIIIEESRLLNESVSKDEINTALDLRKRVKISYLGEKEVKPSTRYIDVYAYGRSKAGNDVIRVYQTFGFTTTERGWKLLRVDRILNWEQTNAWVSYRSISKNPDIPNRNPNGDDSMIAVYKVAQFPERMRTKTPVINTGDTVTNTSVKQQPTKPAVPQKNVVAKKTTSNNAVKQEPVKIQVGKKPASNNTGKQEPSKPQASTTTKKPITNTPVKPMPSKQEPVKTQATRKTTASKKPIDNNIDNNNTNTTSNEPSKYND